MDYVTEALNDIVNWNRSSNNDELAQMDYEFALVSYMLENKCLTQAVVTETAQAVQEASGSEGNGFTNFIKRIVEFFKNIIDKFTAKVKELMDFNGRWLEKNAGKIKNMKFPDSLSVKIYPEYNMNWNKIRPALKEIVNKVNIMPDNEKLKNLQTREDILKAEFSKYINPEAESEKDEWIKYFKFGKNGKTNEAVELKGKEFQQICINEMLPYVQTDYPKIVGELREHSNKIKNSLNKIERSMRKDTHETVGESFLLLEENYLYNTDLSFILLEDGEQAAKNGNGVASGTNEAPKNDNKDKEEESTKKEEIGKVTDGSTDENKYKSMNNLQIKYIQILTQIIQLAVSSAMNVLEARYKTYMKVLRGLVKSDNSKKKEEKKEKEDSKQTSANDKEEENKKK